MLVIKDCNIVDLEVDKILYNKTVTIKDGYI